MTRTSPLTIALLALLGAGGGWLLEVALVVSGRAAAVPPLTLSFALAAIGAILIALALPVRRAVRGRPGTARIDPFYATRVVVLAKASSLSGALLAGAATGILVFLLSRSVIAAAGSVGLSAATAIGAVVLLACGLVAEFLCTIPPEDDDTSHDSPLPERL